MEIELYRAERLRSVGRAGPNVDRVERGGCGHEEQIALRAAKADICAGLREENHAKALTGRIENVHAIDTIDAVSGARP